MLLRLRPKILRFEITKLKRLEFCRERFPFFFYQRYIAFVVPISIKMSNKNGGSTSPSINSLPAVSSPSPFCALFVACCRKQFEVYDI